MIQEYKIETISDFLKVPEDKRAACLDDFTEWMSMVDNADLHVKLNSLAGVECSIGQKSFIWVDDGICGISGLDFVVGEAV